ncbi:MAG: ComF family protein [Corallococcus sp.]|nr:ComF family protein [Corallococcus sp.]MCM1360004.1 ComF family protein [Corallococcus sp.]MCM1395561.1 ComF family protein [Corallococcus sp.]
MNSKRSFKYKMRSILDKIAEAVAPVEFSCMVCGREIFDGLGFCSDCKKNIVFNNGKTCKRCGVGIEGDEDYCGNCAFDKMYFERSYSAFSYEGAVQKAILLMKFGGRGRYAKIFAKYLAYLASKHNLQFDVVCFPPMSAKSKRKRGYNQSQLLARYFCDIMDRCDSYLDAIVKVKETERQEKLGKADRKENLVGAYKVNADVKGKRVLVIDDVKTTGATLNECAKVLKKAGAVSVVGLTVSARKENIPYEVE